ncbi:diacylglycerol/lipid kinase family protein [Aeromicrobium piscarium]|uniref:Diacylglycerol kinase n=1 Tax=Aeromicrobium piscarium TaxID=2590901 RepID=A0A554RP00_9ACTN|nr:diacylglycerol kinase family protein [Aeromicrobium piscarium]TSD55806.1 diacylglycerol kinase [Aeromicrobium piscarium]
MPRLLAITNASAGTSTTSSIDAAVEVLSRVHEVDTVATGSTDELDAALAERPDLDAVVVFGGDGSLHAVVDAVHRAGRLDDLAVGLVPLGTGNDFSRTLGLPLDPAAAAERILGSEGRRIDLLEDFGGAVVVNAASIGLGAEAAVRAKRYKKRWGPLGYAIGAAKSAFVPDAKVEVKIDGRPVRRRHGHITQLSVGNGRFVGGGTDLFPTAEIDDGQMDVQVVFAHTLAGRAAYVVRLLTRTTDESPLVHYERAQRVEVHGEGLRCTSDGEISDPCPDHTWQILPGALTFLA